MIPKEKSLYCWQGDELYRHRGRTMPVPYTPLAIANHFISRFGSDRGIEHMKLQKLVYCSHGWWLVYHPTRPLVDERPQVWRHGPVFDSLYHTLKPFGRSPIYQPQSPNPFEDAPTVDPTDNEVERLLSWVWGRYGHLSSFALSAMTHKTGTPWNRVAQEHNFSVPNGLEIPDSYIIEEFSGILQREFGSPAEALDAGRSRTTSSSAHGIGSHST